MESVGEFFRQVRETKGLTVDEVASKTRIRTDFVKALEEGNFAKLPDQVFARGFVRSYARSLGLDEEDAIHRFVQSAGAFYEKQGERGAVEAAAGRRGTAPESQSQSGGYRHCCRHCNAGVSAKSGTVFDIGAAFRIGPAVAE
jgi:cytoskeletal protein RodZ